MDGSVLGSAALIAAAIGVIKSYVELPRWVPMAVALLASCAVVYLGTLGGEVSGTPLEIANQALDTFLITLGMRTALQTTVESATGNPLTLRNKTS